MDMTEDGIHLLPTEDTGKAFFLLGFQNLENMPFPADETMIMAEKPKAAVTALIIVFGPNVGAIPPWLPWKGRKLPKERATTGGLPLQTGSNDDQGRIVLCISLDGTGRGLHFPDDLTGF